MEITNEFLQLWLEIYKEAIHLCEAIDKLPDHCECRDAEAHLEGRCPCCREHKDLTEVLAHTESCTVLLTRLRADLTILSQDFGRVAMPISAATIGLGSLELRRGIYLAAEDLQRITKTVDRIQEEVAGFRRSCDLTELHGIKQRAKELREHFNQLNLTFAAGKEARPPEASEDL